MLALSSQWEKVMKNQIENIKLNERTMLPYKLQDVHHAPLVWMSTTLVALIVLYIITCVVAVKECFYRLKSYYQSRKPYNRNKLTGWVDSQHSRADKIGLLTAMENGEEYDHPSLRKRKSTSFSANPDEMYDTTMAQNYTLTNKYKKKQRLPLLISYPCMFILVVGCILHILISLSFLVAMVQGAEHVENVGLEGTLQFVTFLTNPTAAADKSDSKVKVTLSPLNECRIVFTAMLMTLCTSFVFCIEVMKALNFNYLKAHKTQGKGAEKSKGGHGQREHDKTSRNYGHNGRNKKRRTAKDNVHLLYTEERRLLFAVLRVFHETISSI